MLFRANHVVSLTLDKTLGQRQFRPRNVVEEKYTGGKKKFRVLCGTVNAKNRMGGYNGMSYWLAIDYGEGFKGLRMGDGAEVLCRHHGASGK